MTTVVNWRRWPATLGPNEVNIMRPGKWGNPFIIGLHGDRAAVIEKHREWLRGQRGLIAEARVELKDKVLVCVCTPATCHGDTLARVADGGMP